MSKEDSNPPQPAQEPHSVNEIRGWRWGLLLILSWCVRLWTASLRYQTSPEAKALLTETDKPRIFLFWHNRLFIAAETVRRYRSRPATGLISASKDGAWLAALYKLLKVGHIRGSSSYRGAQALGECIKALEAGSDLAITPDGPRGPRYSIKSGPAFIARHTNAPLTLVAAHFPNAHRFKSWDGFYLPYPLTKVTLRCATYADMESLRAQFPQAESDETALKAAMDKLHLED